MATDMHAALPRPVMGHTMQPLHTCVESVLRGHLVMCSFKVANLYA